MKKEFIHEEFGLRVKSPEGVIIGSKLLIDGKYVEIMKIEEDENKEYPYLVTFWTIDDKKYESIHVGMNRKQRRGKN